MRAHGVAVGVFGLLVGSGALAEDAPAVVHIFPAPRAAGAVQLSGLAFEEIWFAQPNANTLARVNRDGSLTERALPGGSQPLAISRHPFEQLLIFTELGTNRIGTLAPNGAFTEYDIPTPASGPRGVARTIPGNSVWFTEYDGNRIGRFEIGNPGSITEFPIQTFASGPLGISEGPGGAWFTENLANKIGRIDGNGAITEFDIPTPDSGPTAITWYSSGSENSMFFTETRGNKIGKIAPTGQITERPIPTPNSGPADIVFDLFEESGVWFTERTAGRIGWMSAAGKFREFRLPGGSKPEGLALGYGRGYFGPASVWYVDGTKRVVGRLSDNHLFAVGAADSETLDTELEIANPRDESVKVRLGWPPAGRDLVLPRHGTVETAASAIPLGPSRFLVISGIEPEISDVPDTEAWVVDARRPDTRVRLPLVSYWQVAELQPPFVQGRAKPVLDFPARRRNNVRTSLILAGIEADEADGGVLLDIEAVDPLGEAIARLEVEVAAGGALELSRIFPELGIFGDFDGRLKVTRLSRTGYFWGVVEIYEDDILTRLMPPGSELEEPEPCVGGPAECYRRQTRVVTRGAP